MKKLLLAIIAYLSLTITYGQEMKDINSLTDTAYIRLSKESYSTEYLDTIEFNDGIQTYAFVKVKKYRSDTTLTSGNRKIHFKADTEVYRQNYPEYLVKKLALGKIRIDTIYSADDPNKYVIERIDSININYAKSYKLAPDTFSSSINELIEMLNSQEIETVDIILSYFPNHGQSSAIELMTNKDFKEVDLIKANFLLEKDSLMMTYPVIFEK